jgi:Ca-activated chloride channel family protein
MKIDARLTFDKIRHDQDKNAHLVLTLTAPVKEGEEARPNLCVVPVIDVSGSMAGDKLEYAKRSALKLIDHLKPGDICGLIAFESRVHVIIAPTKITNEVKDKLKAEVGKLHVMGGTNFAGGMLKAIELVNNLDLPDGFLQRIIMLTDGQANEGPATKPDAIIRLLGANAGRVTASAFGYGVDTDQNFLGDFAKNGKGNYAFIRDPDGALAAFGKELGGLASTYATDLAIEVSPLVGHSIERVITDVEAESEDVGGEVNIKISDVLAEEQRHLVFAVKLKEQKQAFPRAVNVFDVKFGYDVIDANGKREHKTGEAKAKVHFVKAGDEDSKANADLDKIVGLHEVIRAQLEAEEQAKKGNFAAAQGVMNAVSNNVRHRGLAAAACAADGIGMRLSDSRNYTANQGYLRSFSGGGTRGMSLSAGDEAAVDELCSYGVQMSNSVQTSTSNAFTGGVGQVIPAVGDANAPPVWGANVPVIGGNVPAVWGGDPNAFNVQAPIGGIVQPFINPIIQPVDPDAALQAILMPSLPQTNVDDDAKAKPAPAKKSMTKKIKQSKSSTRW